MPPSRHPRRTRRRNIAAGATARVRPPPSRNHSRRNPFPRPPPLPCEHSIARPTSLPPTRVIPAQARIRVPSPDPNYDAGPQRRRLVQPQRVDFYTAVAGHWRNPLQELPEALPAQQQAPAVAPPHPLRLAGRGPDDFNISSGLTMGV